MNVTQYIRCIEIPGSSVLKKVYSKPVQQNSCADREKNLSMLTLRK